jgi:hypothetical protein
MDIYLHPPSWFRTHISNHKHFTRAPLSLQRFACLNFVYWKTGWSVAAPVQYLTWMFSSWTLVVRNQNHWLRPQIIPQHDTDMKMAVFWNVAQCGLVDISTRLRDDTSHNLCRENHKFHIIPTVHNKIYPPLYYWGNVHKIVIINKQFYNFMTFCFKKNPAE